MDRHGVTAGGRQRGVTLLELLVVVGILALVTSVAVFNAPPPRSDARDEADRFAARARAAYEDAVLLGVVASIELRPEAYTVARYANGEWRTDSEEGRFGERKLPRGVAMTVTVEDGAMKNRRARRDPETPRRIILDPIGLTTPFVIEFSDRRERWFVRSTENMEIVVEADVSE